MVPWCRGAVAQAEWQQVDLSEIIRSQYKADDNCCRIFSGHSALRVSQTVSHYRDSAWSVKLQLYRKVKPNPERFDSVISLLKAFFFFFFGLLFPLHLE